MFQPKRLQQSNWRHIAENMFLKSHCFFAIFLILVSISSILCFEDSAIFEEEDIYKQALPVDPNLNQTGLTIPGTKWCGPGDTASNYNDLGSQRETDMCCRAHDNCPNIIQPSGNKYGLQNPDYFTRLSCECEQEFLNCLQRVNNYASIAMGKAYFTLRQFCFKNEHPQKECATYQQGMIRKRCVRYRFDKTKPKKWQWFDIPYFTN